jgi:RNA polymerase sigma-70 factor, ECF subfamily
VALGSRPPERSRRNWSPRSPRPAPAATWKACALLDPGVVWRADGGSKVTATRPVARGADEVARWLLSFMRRPPTLVRMASVNGSPGLVVRDGGGVLTVVAFTVDRGRITALDAIRNPDKLTALPEVGPAEH